MIKAVLFDVDGVLLDSFAANLKFFQELMTKAGYPPPTQKAYTALFHFSMHDLITKLIGPVPAAEFQRVWDMGASREVQYDIGLLAIPQGAENVLARLQKKYALGIVTSRIQDSVFEAPQLAALQKYFSAVVSYEDTELHKPHPAPLLLAAQKLGVAPEECVYVGDVENDVLAARAAGMKIIAYAKEALRQADVSTSTFAELPAFIALM